MVKTRAAAEVAVTTPRTWTITVPVDVGKLAPNRRVCWQEKARLTRAQRQAGRLCWLALGSPEATGRVTVAVVIRRGRRLDADALLACCKATIDGIFNDALTPDDSPTWVTYAPARQETGAYWKGKEEVVFTIKEVL